LAFVLEHWHDNLPEPLAFDARFRLREKAGVFFLRTV